MKKATHIFFAVIVLVFFTIQSCMDPFSERTVTANGRIVEGYDSDKPIDSVLIEVCTGILLPGPWFSCGNEEFTDADGFFHFELDVEPLTGIGLNLYKSGYSDLDSCITLSNGELECYMEPLPTNFYLNFRVKKQVQFLYDSATINVTNDAGDTTFYLVNDSYLDTNGNNVYTWKLISDEIQMRSSTVSMVVNDNSSVFIKGNYYQDQSLELIETDTLFAGKGIGIAYFINEE